MSNIVTYHNIESRLERVVIHSNSKFNPKLRYIFNKQDKHVLGMYVPLLFVHLFWVLCKLEENFDSLGDEFVFVVDNQAFMCKRDTFKHNASLLKPKIKQAFLYAYTEEDFNRTLIGLKSHRWKDHLLAMSPVVNRRPSLIEAVEECQNHLNIGSDSLTMVKAIFNRVGVELQ